MQSKIASTLDLDRILEIILNTSIELCSAERGCIRFVDKEEGVLKRRLHKGEGWIEVEFTSMPKKGEGISGWVWETGKGYVARSIDKDPHFYKDAVNTKSEMAVPIFSHEEPRAVITLSSSIENHFSQDDLTLLTDIVNRASVPIEKAMLFSTLQEGIPSVSNKREVTELIERIL